ncbi:MAG TPA: hypothetical protein VFU41_02805 [Gemmatimonadales bacterium]|nr:hypothetical protein [Gemmatimonadales bacterium]
MRGCVPLVVIGMLSGCHTYLPLGTVEPQVGTRVSAELTGEGSDTLARHLGPGITALRGDVVFAEDADVILSVTSVTDRAGQEKLWKREQVRVPRVAVQSFQRRKFSLGRSLLLSAAVLGGSVAAWEWFQGGITGGGFPSGGDGGRPR